MKKKTISNLVTMTALSVAVSSVSPIVALATEENNATQTSENKTDENQESESKSDENQQTEIPTFEENENMSVTEVENEDGSKTTIYEFTEEVNVKDLIDAAEKAEEIAEEKRQEQEQIKSEIEDVGGEYNYTIEIKDNSTEEPANELFQTKEEAEDFAEDVNGTITEIEGITMKGETSSKDGFESEETAKEWADEEAKRLEESQVADTSEKVTTEITISKVEGTGITEEEPKEIETKKFKTYEEAKEYAESFNDAQYDITEVDGEWICAKKDVTATDDDGNQLLFDSKEEADKYIEDNKLEGGIFETIEIVNSTTKQITETIIITATSYDEFERKINELFAEAENNPNISFNKTKDYILDNYETSINFEEMTEEQKKKLMQQMEDDAKDQNYTYTHLDLQTAAKITVYDEEGNTSEVECSIKDDNTLKVQLFTEIDGRLTLVEMDGNITKDSQGYWEICSKDRSLDISKCFVLISGNLTYKIGSKTVEKAFSTIGYLNNDYNTCKDAPGKTTTGKYDKFIKPNDKYHNNNTKTSGGYDIIIDNFVMDSKGTISVSSNVVKVYTITVTKTSTKYVVQYKVDDPENGEYEKNYQVSGTYVEETEIPAEYIAEITSQLTDILYDVNYTEEKQDFSIIVDGKGNINVIATENPEPENPEPENPEPENPEPENPDSTPSKNTTTEKSQDIIFIELPFEDSTEVIEIKIPENPISTQVEVPTIETPRTGDDGVTQTAKAGMAAATSLIALLTSCIPFGKKKKWEK